MKMSSFWKTELLKIKNIITENINLKNKLNSKLDTAQVRICEIENKYEEITLKATERNKETEIMRHRRQRKQVRMDNMCLKLVPKKDKRGNERGGFKEIIPKNFLETMTDVNCQMKEAHTMRKINRNNSVFGHIIATLYTKRERRNKKTDKEIKYE